MSNKRPRVFGTTEGAIAKAESALNRRFPPSFRAWLLQNNGHAIEGVTIFPVMDERDPRMTWDSIDRHFRQNWTAWLENFEDEDRNFTHLLPFADYGTGDFYCFDYSRQEADGEAPVVRWSHETGDTDPRASSFSEFVIKLQAGEFKYD